MILYAYMDRAWASAVSYCEVAGKAGIRYTAYDVAKGLRVEYCLVLHWLKTGVLRGARDHTGQWRIRHKAIRRALRDSRIVTSAMAEAAERRAQRGEV